jgi:hypothetical protein
MYAELKKALNDIAAENGLMESEVNITAKILTFQKSLGTGLH